MSPEERRAQGIAAKAILDDATIKAVFDGIESAIHDEWANAWTQRGRERLHAELRAFARVRARLVSMAGQAPRI